MHASEPVIAAPMRIAKAMARAGLCSRREAERWVEAGRVTLNGKLLASPAVTVAPDDRVDVDGQAIPARLAIRLWRYHKPRGRLTTRSDPQGRATVFADLPKALSKALTVGRLDFNTEGLLLLTSHGGLARHLELPATGLLRRYRVRAHGQVSQDALDGLKQGVSVDGTAYAPADAVLERRQGQNAWLNVTLREGKNREVKVLLKSLGLEVNRLIRVQYGPFELGALKPGEVAELPPAAVAQVLPPELAPAMPKPRPAKSRRRRRAG